MNWSRILNPICLGIISLTLMFGLINKVNADTNTRMMDLDASKLGLERNAETPHNIAISCAPKSEGILNNMILAFIDKSTKWMDETNKIAHKIFILLFAMEFLWQLIIKKIFVGDIEKLWVFFLVRIILGLFFAKYVINIELYKGVIQYMAGIGMHIAGLGLDPAATKLADLGPSRIISYFTCVTDAVHTITDDVGVLQFITLKITLAIIQVLLFIVLSIMAYCVIAVYVQMYFLLYAGFILTGFAGSSWTMGYWQKYMQTVSYVAIKFFTVCILMGFLIVAMTEWTTQFIEVAKSDNYLISLGGVCINVLGSAIILGLMMWELPEWAATRLSATINFNLQDRMTASVRGVSGER